MEFFGLLLPSPFYLFITLIVLILVASVLSHILHRSSTPTTDTFLLGSTFPIFSNWHRLYDWLTEITLKEKGKTWCFTLPFQPKFFIITEPTLCEYILKTNFDNYEKGELFRRNFHDFLGDGIFNADGDLWHMQRKRSSHMFSVNSFKSHMFESFLKHGHVFLSLLSDAPHGGVVNLNDLFMRYTLDSIGEIGFGYEVDSLHNPSHTFARSFDFIQNLANLRFFLPTWMKYCNPLEYSALSHKRDLSRIADDCLHQHHTNPNKENSVDFLAMFMNHKDKSEQFYKDLIMNFTIAGRDTTGLALSWMFWLLSLHPQVEQKVIEEIEREIGDNPLTYERINQLKYTEAVFSETLRLYPSVPKDGKVAIRDDVLPDGTVIPAGSLVVYAPYVMGRREDLWQNANEFQPERFVEEPKPSPYKFIAFQAGPRTCLGQRMAYLEAKVITALIYQNGFRFRTLKGFQPTYGVNLTLSMKSGLQMCVEHTPKRE
jgi:cytochrome P450